SLPTDHHPYASYDAEPETLARIAIGDVKAAHKRWFVPKNTFIVVAGDTTPDDVKASVAKAFGSMKGGEPPVLSYPEPTTPEKRRITLVHRPRASQSDVFVGVLGLERADKNWPAYKVLNQVLGGGV